MPDPPYISQADLEEARKLKKVLDRQYDVMKESADWKKHDANVQRPRNEEAIREKMISMMKKVEGGLVWAVREDCTAYTDIMLSFSALSITSAFYILPVVFCTSDLGSPLHPIYSARRDSCLQVRRRRIQTTTPTLCCSLTNSWTWQRYVNIVCMATVVNIVCMATVVNYLCRLNGPM
jgi:hypothetical protein